MGLQSPEPVDKPDSGGALDISDEEELDEESTLDDIIDAHART